MQLPTANDLRTLDSYHPRWAPAYIKIIADCITSYNRKSNTVWVTWLDYGAHRDDRVVITDELIKNGFTVDDISPWGLPGIQVSWGDEAKDNQKELSF